LLAEAAAAAALAYMAFEDVRRREVRERDFALLMVAVVAAKVVDWLAGRPIAYGPLPLNLYLALDGVMLAAASVLALLRLYGWGDVAAMLMVAVASPGAPPGGVTPAVVLTMMYSAVILVFYAAANALLNLARHRELLRRVPPSLRLLYLLAARPVKVRELLERPGWRYPLNLCGEYRARFNIYLDPPDIARMVREAVRRGCVGEEDYVWVAHGHPGIALIAAGYTATLALGDPLKLVAGAGSLEG